MREFQAEENAAQFPPATGAAALTLEGPRPSRKLHFQRLPSGGSRAEAHRRVSRERPATRGAFVWGVHLFFPHCG